MDRVDKVAFALRKREKPRVFFKLPTAFPQCVESIQSYPHIREKIFSSSKCPVRAAARPGKE